MDGTKTNQVYKYTEYNSRHTLTSPTMGGAALLLVFLRLVFLLVILTGSLAARTLLTCMLVAGALRMRLLLQCGGIEPPSWCCTCCSAGSSVSLAASAQTAANQAASHSVTSCSCASSFS